MKKLRVGVFMGGKSIEHEVSFNSGRTVCDHLSTARYEIVPVYQVRTGELYILPWHFLHRGTTTDFAARLEREARCIVWDELATHVDFMYLAVHGRYAEDGTLQGMLEVLGIPYLGSKILASALCMDKSVQKDVLRSHGIAVAPGFVVYPHELKDLEVNGGAEFVTRVREAELKAPFIVKPSGEGSSLGVEVIATSDRLVPAIMRAATINENTIQPVLIEEKLVGMEFSCIVISDAASLHLIPLTPTEIAHRDENAIFDYEQKYMPGLADEHTPARCSAEDLARIQDICVRVTKLLDIQTISRVDGFLKPDGTVVIFEANTLSGMGPASLLFRQAAELGMSHTTLINHLIKTQLCAYGTDVEDADTHHDDDHAGYITMATTKKMRVAVLLGGATSEREISLESGRNVVYKLVPDRYEAVPIFVDDAMNLFAISQAVLVRNATAEIKNLVKPQDRILWSDLPRVADFVFIALHGGLGENGAVQGALEMLGVPYNGSSVLASALCMDKYKANEFLRARGIDVPASVFIERGTWHAHRDDCVRRITQTCRLPAIVKPHDDGCSFMVQKVRDEVALVHAIDTIFSTTKTHALVEEFIVGTELTVGVLGNAVPRALPPSQTVVNGDVLSIEEKFLPGAGENQTPALIAPEARAFVQSLMEKAFSALGCKGYARIDCFYQNSHESPTGSQRVVILEINTLPGLTPATCLFHQASEVGMRPMDLITAIVELGLEHHEQRTHAVSLSGRERVIVSTPHL